MQNFFKNTLLSMLCFFSINYLHADPTVGNTTVLGPFSGPGATLHPDNQSPNINWYGTDLGFSYKHNGNIQFLFGDSWANEDPYTAIQNTSVGPGLSVADYDDAFGEVDLGTWSDPSTFSPTNIPTISLGQHTGSAEAKAINPGHIMDLGKTPLGGFSNGSREYGIFLTTKPQGCRVDSDCDNQLSDLTCDQGLGFWAEEYYDERGFTGVCMDGTPLCLNNTMANIFGWPISGTGFCNDETSSVWDSGSAGRMRSVGIRLTIGVRSTSDPRNYNNTEEWLTNKFFNQAVTTVTDFVPANGSGASNQNYNLATSAGGNQRVFLWGRPGFVGVNDNNRSLSLYFAYVDLPTGGSFNWVVNYYTGTLNGIPQFSPYESDAAPLDLNANVGGIQADEPYDIVDQMSIAWVDHLEKWVMFYGGGLSSLPTAVFGNCGVLEAHTGPECDDVDTGNGAIRMRTANDPWGPWSPPQDVLVGGDPEANPLNGEYAAGGILHHPDCNGGSCIDHTDSNAYSDDEYGFLYSPNIIEEWIDPVGDDVDIIWNVSTWDPYAVFLVRTRIEAN